MDICWFYGGKYWSLQKQPGKSRAIGSASFLLKKSYLVVPEREREREECSAREREREKSAVPNLAHPLLRYRYCTYVLYLTLCTAYDTYYQLRTYEYMHAEHKNPRERSSYRRLHHEHIYSQYYDYVTAQDKPCCQHLSSF